MKKLKKYDEIVTWHGGEFVFVYDIKAELGQLNGAPIVPEEDGNPHEFLQRAQESGCDMNELFGRTVSILLHGDLETGFAVQMLSSGVENDAPRQVFETRTAAEQEARRLFERRKKFDYLRTLLILKAEDALNGMRAVDESNLTKAHRQEYRRELASMEKQWREVLTRFNAPGRTC